jgi:tetratricopeptide (TPR) repeat protein
MRHLRDTKVSRGLLSACFVLIAGLCLTGCARTPQEQYARFIERGKNQLQNHDYRRAALEFENASRVDPKAAEPHYQLALAYLGNGDTRSAAVSLWKTLALNPQHGAAELKLSELAIGTRDKGEIEAAEKRLRRLVESSPSAEAFNSLAVAAWQLGRKEDAEKILSDASARFPRDLQAAVSRARIKVASRDLAGAEEILKKAVEDNPQSADAPSTLGEFYMSHGRPDEAREQFRRALDRDAKHGRTLVLAAELEWRAGQTKKADQLYKDAASLSDPQYRPLHALFLFRSGMREQAVAEFEKIWNADRTDRQARTRLIAAYRAVGRSADVDKLLADALQKNGKDVDALLERSQLYVSDGKFIEAQAALSTILHFKPDSALAHYLLAKVYHASGATLLCRTQLTEALRLKPDLLQARLELADLLITNKAPKGALDILNDTPAAQKNEPAVLIQQNWAYLGMGNWAEARKGIDALSGNREQADLLVQDGTLKLTQRNFAGARESFERALKTHPDDYKTLNLLVQSYDFQKQFPAGVERIRKLAAERPNSAPVQFFLGELMTQTQHWDEARRAFLAAKAADPKLIGADVKLARLDAMNGKLDDARSRLSEVLKNTPANISARLLLGAIQDRAGNQSAAAAEYREILKMDEGNTEALSSLATLLCEGSPVSYDEALTLAQKAKERAPENPAVEAALGLALYRKGFYARAIPQLEQAIAVEPTGRRKLALAAAYVKTGDHKKGGELAQAALQMDPTLARSQFLRELVAAK